MEYVESFDLLGVAARQKPCLAGKGAPAIPAVTGELYLDTDTGELYKYTGGGWQLHKTGADIPFFDLAAMGLPAVSVTGGSVSWNADLTALMAALRNGPVKVRAGILDAAGGSQYAESILLCTESQTEGFQQVSVTGNARGNPFLASANIQSDGLTLSVLPLGGTGTVPPLIDFTQLGLPTIIIGADETVSVNVTAAKMAELQSLLSSGVVCVKITVNAQGNIMDTLTIVGSTYLVGDNMIDISFMVLGWLSVCIQLWIGENRIDAWSVALA